jgi:D-amino-acid dehydrogenase
MEPMRVTVIGAGIAGVATAYLLARDGHDVTVLERRDAVALETSRANAGILTPSQSPPWNEPGIARQALRFLLETDAKLVVTLRAEPWKFLWLARFLRNSAPARHAAHARAILALARASRVVMDEMVHRHAITFDRTSAGVLTLVRDARDLPAAEASARAIRDLGTAATMLDGPATLALEPSLAPIGRDIVGGILTAEDQSGDIHAFTTALAAAAAEAGVAFRFGVDVQGLRLSAGRVVAVETASGPVAGDAVVLAAGSVSRALGRTASLDLPIYPVQGCSLTYRVPGWRDLPTRPVRDRLMKVAITPLGERIRVSGMAVLDGVRDGIDPRFVDRTRRALRAIFPTLPEHAAETVWSGCRPMTPDGPPILGPTRIPNLFLNTGLGALGWTLGCGAAQVVADLVAGRPPPVDAAAFALAR